MPIKSMRVLALALVGALKRIKRPIPTEYHLQCDDTKRVLRCDQLVRIWLSMLEKIPFKTKSVVAQSYFSAQHSSTGFALHYFLFYFFVWDTDSRSGNKRCYCTSEKYIYRYTRPIYSRFWNILVVPVFMLLRRIQTNTFRLIFFVTQTMSCSAHCRRNRYQLGVNEMW